MKKAICTLTTIGLIISFTSCSSKKASIINNQSQASNKIITSSAPKQADPKTNLVETDSYTVSIPDTFDVTKQLGGLVVVFSKNGKTIGGLDTLIYYADQPEYQLDPNHSLVVSSKKLQNMKYDVLEKKYEMYPPAASGDATKTDVTHLFFIFKDKKIAYDLYFDTSEVNDAAILDIGKSFNLK